MKSKLSNSLFALLACSFLVGCSPMRFSQYSGSRRVWPRSQDSMAETSFSLPVYRTWPDKPFEIVGSLRVEDPNQNWDDGIISAAVSAARSKHGDAIIIRQGSELGVSGYAGFAEDPMVWKQNQTTALVIKWKPKGVLETEAAALRAFKENFRAQHPELTPNVAVVDSAIEYLQFMGLSLDSGAAADKLKDILTEFHGSREGELNGKWLYRCNYTRSRLTSSSSDFFYGTALVTLKDNVLTIVSTSGLAEVNFSGTSDKGRVMGKMGISAVSINCDGVASKEKISLSGQGQIADGTFQASLIFLR